MSVGSVFKKGSQIMPKEVVLDSRFVVFLLFDGKWVETETTAGPRKNAMALARHRYSPRQVKLRRV